MFDTPPSTYLNIHRVWPAHQCSGEQDCWRFPVRESRIKTVSKDLVKIFKRKEGWGEGGYVTHKILIR